MPKNSLVVFLRQALNWIASTFE